MAKRSAWVLPAAALAAALVAGQAGASAQASPAARAAVSCPVVDSGTGAVTPPPAPNVNWSGCDLDGAAMSGADLANDNLSQAGLTGADLSGTQLTNVKFGHAVLSSADIAGADLTGADLTAADLTSADLTDATLDAVLTGATLTGATLTGATMYGVSSGTIKGTPAALPANWTLAGGYLIGPGASLPGASLNGAGLAGADLASADLDGAFLTGATLTGADLSAANLTGAYLDDADLDGANAGATMTGADLAGADVDTADLSGAWLSGATSGGITGTPAALPSGWVLDAGYLIGAGANLTGADLSGLSLPGADLTDATFTSANLTGADLAGATMLGAKLDGATLTGASLGSANLSGASLTGAKLGDAGLTDAKLTGANLSDAKLTDTDLTDASLTGADLAGVTLTGALLAGAGLAGVASGSITGTPGSLPAGWVLTEGYLLGPGAVAEHAYLHQVSLAGYDLSGIDFYDALLDGVDLTGANLSDGAFRNATIENSDLDGADVTGADFSGATWSDTTCPDGTLSEAHAPDSCTAPPDTVPPSATPAVTVGTAGSNGWYISKVIVSWNWTDNGTIDATACPQASVTSGNGPITLNATCADYAGNVGEASYQVNVDTTAPAVSLTGVRAGRRYVLGDVPVAGCATTDAVSGVAMPASLTVTTTGSHGAGPFTASCAGALSVAGDKQAAPVSAGYTVVYGMDGFLAPKPGSTLRKSARQITVRFRLADASGQPASPAAVASLAAAGRVGVTLRGPGIRPVTARCAWVASGRYLRCQLPVPAGVRTGRTSDYTITAAEHLGAAFVTVPAVGGAVDPEVIHFR